MQVLCQRLQIHVFIAITCNNSLSRYYSLMLPANRSMSLVQICSLFMMCPELHHLSLTNPASSTPFFLPFPFVLSACIMWKLSNATFVSRVSAVSQVFMNSIILHSWYFLWCQVCAANSYILSGKELTFRHDDRGEDLFGTFFSSTALSPGTGSPFPQIMKNIRSLPGRYRCLTERYQLILGVDSGHLAAFRIC